MLDQIVNLDLLANPLNWIIVWLVLAIGAAVYAMLSGYAVPSPISFGLNLNE